MDPTAVIEWIGAGALVYAFICCGLGTWISLEKGRGSGDGAILGFLLGPLGLIVLALLPNGPEFAKGKGGDDDDDDDEVRRRIAEMDRRAAKQPKPRRLLGEVTEQ